MSTDVTEYDRIETHIMPELPDLEAYARNLEKMVSGKQVIEILLYHSDRVNVTQQNINDALVSAKLVRFKRNGKEMRIEFDNGKAVSIHLMLEGKFHVIVEIDDVAFKLFAFKLDDIYLVVSDPKYWAKMELDPESSNNPDALSPDFSLDYFREKLAKKSAKNIKAFLIDQNIVRGIGNAYVDEILWEAKVSPESKAGKLPDDVARRLYEAVGMVLSRSVDEILQINPDLINGEIRDFMRVHNKKRKVCPNGFPIHTKTIASKITYYTEEQMVY